MVNGVCIENAKQMTQLSDQSNGTELNKAGNYRNRPGYRPGRLNWESKKQGVGGKPKAIKHGCLKLKFLKIRGWAVSRAWVVTRTDTVTEL